MQLQRLQAEAAARQTARMQYARALQEELQKPKVSAKLAGASYGNSKDNSEAQPEKKKGLKCFFSKK